MTVNDVNDVSEQSSSDVPVRSLQSIFNEMYPALASPPRVVVRHGCRLYAVTPREANPNHEVSVPLPRHSLIAPQRSLMVHESPDVRAGDRSASFESPSRTSPLERRAQGSSSHPREDVTPPIEWESRILVNVINYVGGCVLDLEDFTRGDYQTCAATIRRARELSSLETEEGKNELLCLCAWPHHYNRMEDREDTWLAMFAIERFRRKHNGPLGDHMSPRHYNRYLGLMWIIDGVLMCCDHDD